MAKITKANAATYCLQLEAALDRFIEYGKEGGNQEYKRYLPMALWVKDHYQDSIALHILEFADGDHFTGTAPVYPSIVLHFLYYVRDFVFSGYTSEAAIQCPQDLEGQNDNSRKYVHFDFSVRKPTTITAVKGGEIVEDGTLTVDEYEYLTDLLKARQSAKLLQEESDLVDTILIKLQLQPLTK